jgi:uncharacterized protein YjbI with pentapeptide repeats
MTELAGQKGPISAPYPGTAPFQDRREDRLVFFGRDQENRDLTTLVLSEPQVLLFARSGVGKTSLINAGLLENLRQRKFFTISARVTDEPEQSPVAAIFDAVEREAKKFGVTIEGERDVTSLWAYFYHAKFVETGPEAKRTVLKPILVLDQFEELFTLLTKEKRTKFIEEFADLVGGHAPRSIREDALKRLDQISETDPAQAQLQDLAYGRSVVDVKALISIREDFLAELEVMKASIPDIFRHTYRLEPLSPAKARDAISKPSQQRELLGDNIVEFEPTVIDAMIKFLSSQPIGTVLQSEDIEPVQLQILCRSLFERVFERGRNRITAADLGGDKGMRSILLKYYVNVLKKLPPLRFGWNTRTWHFSGNNLWLVNFPRVAARHLCESGLILPNGVRNSLEEAFIASQYGVPDKDLAQLVQQHLLRGESRARGRFYELSHDSLTNVLLVNRATRRVSVALLVAGVLFWVGAFLQPTLIAPALITAYSRVLDYRTDPYRMKVADAGFSAEDRRQALDQLVERSGTNVDLHDQTFTALNLDNYTFQKPADFRLSRLIGSSLRDVRQGKRGDFNLIWFDFRNSKITDTKFDRGNLGLSTFGAAVIDQSTFKSTLLSYASFDGAKITGSDLSNALLAQSSFVTAQLKDVSFASATLRGAIFRGAKLTNVNFTDTALEGARFDGAVIDQKIDFTGAEWWLASGWTDDQFAELQNSFPYLNYTKTPAYLNTLQDYQSKVDAARQEHDTSQLSDKLNSIAWYRAIHGADLRLAQAAADEAVQLNPKINIIDTKAYILMLLARLESNSDQSAQLNEAKNLYVNKIILVDESPKYSFFSGEWYYHYAMVLEYLGESAEAGKYYKLSLSGGYQPTYERLIKPRLKGDNSQ